MAAVLDYWHYIRAGLWWLELYPNTSPSLYYAETGNGQSGEVIMVLGKIAKGGAAGVLLRWASRLRFPYLFFLTLTLFIINLFIPDMVPFADELIMGLIAALLGSLKSKPSDNDSQPPPDV